MTITYKNKKVAYLFFKRVTDIFLSAIALVCFSPIFLFVWMMDLYGENRGPVLYKQKRIGKNGKAFYIYKFRSMVVDADKKLEADRELYKKYVANSFKLPEGEDPRITRFGSRLRKTSLDEIPQFLNILQGNMSIIGPRPVVEGELAEYGDQVDKFLSVKPGAMGYWQANGRSNIGYPERCDLELYYVDHTSYWFDVKVFIKNIISIFKTEGAF